MTLRQWYDTLWGQLSGFSLITELDPSLQETAVKLMADIKANPSRFARIRLQVACHAFGCWLIEALLQRHKQETEENNRKKKLHTEAYFAEKALEFRWNSSAGQAHIPAVNPETYQVEYSATALADETALIVTAAAAVTEDQVTVVKVATGQAGSLTPLASEQVEGVRAFLDSCAGAGQYVYVISADADLIRYTVEIYYREIFGESQSEAAARKAADDYLSLGIVFDGKCNLTKQGDAWQALANGEQITDYVIISAEGRSATGSYNTFRREYQAVSGHMRLDPSSVFIMKPVP